MLLLVEDVLDAFGVKNAEAREWTKELTSAGAGGLGYGLASGAGLAGAGAAAGSGIALTAAAMGGWKTGRALQGWVADKFGDQDAASKSAREATAEKGFGELVTGAVGYLGDLTGYSDSEQKRAAIDHTRAAETQAAWNQTTQNIADRQAESDQRRAFRDQTGSYSDKDFNEWKAKQGVAGLKASEAATLEKEAKERGIDFVMKNYGVLPDKDTNEKTGKTVDPAIQAWVSAWKSRNPVEARKTSTNPMDVYQNQIASGQINPTQAAATYGQSLFQNKSATTAAPTQQSQAAAAPTSVTAAPAASAQQQAAGAPVTSAQPEANKKSQGLSPEALRSVQSVVQTVSNILNGSPTAQQNTTGTSSTPPPSPVTVTGARPTIDANGSTIQQTASPQSRKGTLQMVREDYYNTLKQKLNESLEDISAKRRERQVKVAGLEGQINPHGFVDLAQGIRNVRAFSGMGGAAMPKERVGKQEENIGERTIAKADRKQALTAIMSASQNDSDFKGRFSVDDAYNPNSPLHKALVSKYPNLKDESQIMTKYWGT